jgi:salicylate hydroxylase
MKLAGASVTVLGAGVSGLAVARALALRGAGVRVLEQAPAIAEVGAGIQISPNGGAVLAALGLGPALAAASRASAAVLLRDHAAGAEVLRMDLSGRGRFALVHRADLIALLAEGARAAGVEIRTGVRVASVGFDGPAPVIDEGAGPARLDGLLIGADGLHSVLRGAIPGARPARFTGQVAWRATVPVPPGSVPDAAQVFMAPGRHLVAYPLRDGGLLNLVAVEERGDWTAEGWHHPGDPAELCARFAGFGGPVPDWLARVAEVHLWGLFRHPVMPVWHRGRAALLGDAAHPTLPFLAQGACMALEDAWVLAESLARHGAPAGVAADQAARLMRVRRIVAAAQSNARAYHLRAALVRGMAHAGLRLMGRLLPDAAPDRYAWLWGHDVTGGAALARRADP